MPRPNIVRADTHDLQNHNAPAAQDHSSDQVGPRNANGFGPSQEHAIRQVVEEQAQAQHGQNGGHIHQQMDERDGDELDRELAGAEVAGDDGGFDDDEMMDKMSSSPSIDDEDIDFQMVYALHTFTATVEGQANAAKGENMVLLDDSNSYWWLVRIVRDSSIGYLPAEHIETPMERLARLNKHRNIDLATTMLSDTANEKSKNPLKKAMRRRNAKSVAFTSPTYIEASEYEYSTDEEEEADDGFYDEEGAAREETEDTEAGSSKATNSTVVTATEGEKAQAKVEAGSSNGTVRTSEDGIKMRANPTPAALRHPDSAIFNDENTSTKKLTLTPNLLRDDGTSESTSKEVIKGRSSMERDKLQPSQAKREDSVLSPPPGKDGKKLKKGGSVLGNLFKKRSRKGRKEEEEEVDEWLHGSEKQSIDSSRSMDSVRERNGSRGEEGRKESEDVVREEAKKQRMQQQQREQREKEQREQDQKKAQQQQQAAAATVSTIRRVESETEDKPQPIMEASKFDEQSEKAPEKTLSSPTIWSPTTRSPDMSRKTPDQERELRPENAPIRVKSPAGDPSQGPSVQRKMSGDKPAYSPNVYQPQQHHQQRSIERLSESPEQITFHDASERPDLVVDTSSGADSSSPIDSSPELIDRSSTFDTTTSPGTTVTPAPGDNLGGHTMTRTWSDWSLKTYFEDDNDVRDMLIVVKQDKGEMITSEKIHPEVGPLFEEPNRRLADITMQLDGMLGEWLQRRAKV
ncbi:hypothetical protein EDC01DRAFT_9938 [Geopyxis carbonaria]|nr:hypothetical protein EDC01DRAFT_9938 [Geopyxis carbonaria]